MYKVQTDRDELSDRLYKKAQEKYKKDCSTVHDMSSLIKFMHGLRKTIEDTLKKGHLEEVGLCVNG